MNFLQLLDPEFADVLAKLPSLDLANIAAAGATRTWLEALGRALGLPTTQTRWR
jgi:hypothetical protein